MPAKRVEIEAGSSDYTDGHTVIRKQVTGIRELRLLDEGILL